MAQRRKFSAEFKREAVDLTRRPQISVNQAAQELGVNANVLSRWRRELAERIVPSLPMNSTIYFYGLLGGAKPFSIPSVLFIMKNLTMRRFSNFDSRTVKEHEKLVSALRALEDVIDDPMFTTRIGREFRLDQIEMAMAYESPHGAKAVLVA